MKCRPYIKTYSMYALIILVVLALPTGVFVAYGRDELEPSTFYAGYRAIDRYIYGDLTIDIIYLNPKVYYSYRNAYVVPFNYTYAMPEPLPRDVLRGVAVGVIRKLGAIGVRANYAIVNTYVLAVRGSGKTVVVDRVESTDGAEYTVYESSRGLITKTRDFDFTNYVVITTYSANFLVVDYAGLGEGGKLKAIKVIGDALRNYNISNVTIAVFDERALSLENSYFIDAFRFNKNETLKNMLLEAFNKAANAFTEVNADCFTYGGGKFGGYWISLGIKDTFDKCADAVIRFVNVYVDEIRRIVPEDTPIYIELRENTGPLYLEFAPLRNPQPPLAIVSVIAAIPALVIAWRIARRRIKL